VRKVIRDSDGEAIWLGGCSGLLRVVAAANAGGLHAGALDAHALNLGIDEIRFQLIQAKPSMVGLNPTSVNVPEAKAVAALCDELGIPYVLGGIHATLDPRIAREDFPSAYAIVRGDGEMVIPRIIRRYLGGGGEPIDGVYFAETDTTNAVFAQYAPKMSIENVPVFNQGEYVEYPIVLQDIPYGGVTRRRPEGSVYATRGCPFECGFCASPVMVGRGKKGVRPYDHPGMESVVHQANASYSVTAALSVFIAMAFMVTPCKV
jgi:radical SAM superfamily enzyme YgiQ (UPF0313 family)